MRHVRFFTDVPVSDLETSFRISAESGIPFLFQLGYEEIEPEAPVSLSPEDVKKRCFIMMHRHLKKEVERSNYNFAYHLYNLALTAQDHNVYYELCEADESEFCCV